MTKLIPFEKTKVVDADEREYGGFLNGVIAKTECGFRNYMFCRLTYSSPT
jgi:hypothetical protein